jgi:hypothetical protein
VGSNARKGCCKYQAWKGSVFLELRDLHLLNFFSKEGEIVRWSSDGSKFAVQSGSTIDMYATVRPLNMILFECYPYHRFRIWTFSIQSPTNHEYTTSSSAVAWGLRVKFSLSGRKIVRCQSTTSQKSQGLRLSMQR